MEADPGVAVEILEKRGEDGMEVVGENAWEKGCRRALKVHHLWAE